MFYHKGQKQIWGHCSALKYVFIYLSTKSGIFNVVSFCQDPYFKAEFKKM